MTPDRRATDGERLAVVEAQHSSLLLVVSKIENAVTSMERLWNEYLVRAEARSARNEETRTQVEKNSVWLKEHDLEIMEIRKEIIEDGPKRMKETESYINDQKITMRNYKVILGLLGTSIVAVAGFAAWVLEQLK